MSGHSSLQKLWFKVAGVQGNKEFLEAEHVSVLAANQDLQVDMTQYQCAIHTCTPPVENLNALHAQ